MNCNFHDHERYDSCLINIDGTHMVFGKLISVLGVLVNGQEHLLSVVLPYDRKLQEQGDIQLQRSKKRRDKDLRLHRVRARRMKDSVVMFAATILRGALLAPDHTCDAGDEYFVVDVVDQDMWLRMKQIKSNIMVEAPLH